MDDLDDDPDDWERERRLAQLHYVDRQTIQSPATTDNSSSRVATKRTPAGRYWTQALPEISNGPLEIEGSRNSKRNKAKKPPKTAPRRLSMENGPRLMSVENSLPPPVSLLDLPPVPKPQFWPGTNVPYLHGNSPNDFHKPPFYPNHVGIVLCSDHRESVIEGQKENLENNRAGFDKEKNEKDKPDSEDVVKDRKEEWNHRNNKSNPTEFDAQIEKGQIDEVDSENVAKDRKEGRIQNPKHKEDNRAEVVQQIENMWQYENERNLNEDNNKSNMVIEAGLDRTIEKSPKIGKKNKRNRKNKLNKQIENDAFDEPIIVFDSRKSPSQSNAKNSNRKSLQSKTPKPTNKNAKSKPSVIELESSEDSGDDDDVIVLPTPKEPFINLDSSEEEENEEGEPKVDSKACSTPAPAKPIEKTPKCISPVPSIISSTSDDFIQQDCRRLNLLRDYNAEFQFNFDLHGADLGRNRPSSSKSVEEAAATSSSKDLFATPKSRKQKSTQKSKDYTVPDTTTPTAFIDIYDSESSDFPESVSDVPIGNRIDDSTIKQTDLFINVTTNENMESNNEASITNTPEPAETSNSLARKFLDPKAVVNKISLENCLENMKAFYDESWGGETFDHFKIKRQLPNSKDLWTIDLADKLSNLSANKKEFNKCAECHRFGHREDKCPKKPKKCYMCGQQGHLESKCPNRICLNCGKSNNSYSRKCRHCVSWRNIKCRTCLMFGHPSQNCPDIWRRYHLTIKNEIPLVQGGGMKPVNEMYCSGCAQKGHLQFNCKVASIKCSPSLPFVCKYTPVYVPDGIRNVQDESSAKEIAQSAKDSNVNDRENCASSKQAKAKKSPDPNCKKVKPNNVVPPESPISEITPAKFSDKRPPKSKRPSESGCEVVECKKSKSNDVPRAESPISDGENVDVNSSSPQINSVKSYKLFLSTKMFARLKSPRGGRLLETLSHRHKVTCELLPKSYCLCISYHNLSFLSTVREWLFFGHNFGFHSRTKLIEKLRSELRCLKDYLGNPVDIYKSIKMLESKLLSNDKNSNIRVLKLLKVIQVAYRKLNMVLIGQAGYFTRKKTLIKLLGALGSLQANSMNRDDCLDDQTKSFLVGLYLDIFSSYPLYNYDVLIKLYANASPNAINAQQMALTKTLASFGIK